VSPICRQCCRDFGDENTEEPDHGITTVVSLRALYDGPGSAPCGKLFEETLEHLSKLDRRLMTFSSTSRLPAVRWLLHLKGNPEACDRNGTTCLHAACRTGVVSIVSELVKHLPSPDTADNASWTPLHVAAHMGRREVCARLLQAQASPYVHNSASQTPLQLCLNQGTRDVFRMHEVLNSRWSEEVYPEATDLANVDQPEPIEFEPEWWFVNPDPVFHDTAKIRATVLNIGLKLFNEQPSYGLAFIVAAGVAESYTDAMSMVLASDQVSRDQIGTFLGEALSMCNAMRFGLFDAMPFMSTGVVSSLVIGFRLFSMPEDMEKMDRLVQGIALAWWRHHQFWVSAATMGTETLAERLPPCIVGNELKGLQLLQYFASCDALSHLMFSTALLHWFVHGDGLGPRRHISLATFMRLNQGIEHGGTDVPEHVQRRVYEAVTEEFLPTLAMTPDQDLEHSPSRADKGTYTALTSCADLEDVVEVLDNNLPSIDGESPTPKFIGEVVTGSVGGPAFTGTLAVSGWSRPMGNVIASLCDPFLFFSSTTRGGGGKAPHLLLDRRTVKVSSASRQSFIITLVGVQPPDAPQAPSISVVFLLPDGRWHLVSLAKLDIKVRGLKELNIWSERLSSVPGSSEVL